jgi:hypothetical protein
MPGGVQLLGSENHPLLYNLIDGCLYIIKTFSVKQLNLPNTAIAPENGVL